MAELLRKGYTMMNLSCPVCNNPIFRDKNGEKFCPICDRKVIIVGEKSSTSLKIPNSTKGEIQNSENQFDDKTIILLKNIVIDKISLIANKLKSEDQFEAIKNYTYLMLKLIKLFKKIGKLNNN
ncbi:MAG: Sjogren's syndrome/scleroderma autoantigen 1 family protein [Promethearchaeota archaeon]